MNIRARILLPGLVALLSACGGGSGGGSALPAPQAAAVNAALCADASAVPGSFQQIDGQCLRSTTALAAASPQSAAQPPQAAVAPDATTLMDWAELTYPQFFPSRRSNLFSSPYTYRYYPESQNHLGIAGDSIYVLGPMSGNQIAYVGSLSGFACAVLPANCAVPGAPVIGTATPGSTSATIAFTAPASAGGSAITSYTAACTAQGSTRSATGAASPITVLSLSGGVAYSCTVSATNVYGTGSPSAALTVTPTGSTSTGSATTTTGSGTTTASTSTSGVMCSFSQSVMNSFLNLVSTAAISCSGTQRTITGNGVPDHTPGTFPNSGNPHAIAAQNVRFTNTTSPAVVSSTGTAVSHILGYANNSIKFDPSTAESYQNAGVWKIEALNQTYFALGLDSSNAHVQPGGAYHYHGMPEGYITRLNKGTAMTLVGFAVDGFPMYARYGYNTATNAASGTRVIVSSYRMKTTPSSGRPSTTAVPMGTFTQDYEYVAGLGDLDECNGRFGVTPEFPSGIYHYYITDSYPYIQRCVKGTAASTTGP
ncbi:MAG: YHYH protein [Ramlibacter sp.]